MANATYSTGLYVNYGSAALYLDIYETTDPGNNRSLIRGVLTLAHGGSGSPFNNNASSASMTLAGNTWGWSGGYNLPGNSSMTLIDQSIWVGHNDTGSGSLGVSGSFSGNGNWPIGSGSVSGTYTMADFDRRPGSASFSSVSRTLNSYRVVLNPVSSPAAGLYYQTQISTNGAAYTDTRGGTDNTYSNLPLGSYFYFAAWTGNNDGATGAVYSGPHYTPSVPGAPGPLTVGPVAGRSTTITTGNATTGSNGTATISAGSLTYFVQASPDNGTTWLPAQTMSLVSGVQSYTYTGLNGGATYRFRVYATNEVGTGPFTTTTSGTFVPAGGKRYDSTSGAFINANTASRRNETNTAWTPLTITRKYVASESITNAVGNGTVVTYTAKHNLSVGDVVTITGVSPAAYNLASATVASVTRERQGDVTSGTAFTINSNATGTYSTSSGVAVVGWRDFV